MRSITWCYLAAAALGALALAACSHKGKTREPALLEHIVQPSVRPDRMWTRHTDGGAEGFYASLRPVLGEDAIYTASSNGDVDAHDLKTGHLLWRVQTHLRILAGPSVSGDMILVGTAKAEVRALRRKDGSTLWTGEAPSEVLGPPVTNGRVVVVRGVDGRVFGLDASSGQRVWSFDRTEPALTLRGMSTPVFANDHVIIGLDNGRLVSLSADDGKLDWEQAISNPSGRTELDRLVDIDGDLLLTGHGVFVASYGGDVDLVDPTSGEARWHRSIKSSNGFAIDTDGSLLFVSDDDGYVWALDAKTGAQVWENKKLQYRLLSPPAAFDTYVVVGDYKGYLHWLNMSDGKIVGRSRLGSDPIVAAPVVSGEGMYVMDAAGKIALYRNVKF